MPSPVRFCFGLHLHQPVGNFDSVFRDHLELVYGPVLDGLERGGSWPVAIHLSGPLLDWLEHNASEWVDRLGRHVDAGEIELLGSGHDEPILAVLDHEDRLDQLTRHRDRLRSRFGVEVSGLWLTERVWEPDLPGVLAQAGFRFVLVDDHHLRVTGLPARSRHRPWVTEHDGARIAVLAIDQNLRYLVPFRPPEELAEYLNTLRHDGHRLAVLADDGEKFGGWPGTATWVWEDGWFDRFTAQITQMRENGVAMLSRFDDALSVVPSEGPIYLPSASYQEMERWALPASAARELTRRQEASRAANPAGEADPLLRGGHWRHFLAKYPESNRLHKMMQFLSRASRNAGDPPDVRRHVGRAQCNDAYWHGVFGGLYLPFLRDALWRELASAARLLWQDRPPQVTTLDFDADGREEIVLTTSRHIAVIAPHRGGGIDTWLDLTGQGNWADCMTRHEEAYHLSSTDSGGNPADDHPASEGASTIHDAETQVHAPPALDRETRTLLVDRVLPHATAREEFIDGTVEPLHSWACTSFTSIIEAVPHGVAVRMTGAQIGKTLIFHADGPLDVHWTWEGEYPTDAWFSTELSFAHVPRIVADGAERWDYTIETVSRSEAGFDRMTQGEAVVLRWPISRRSASIRIIWQPA